MRTTSDGRTCADSRRPRRLDDLKVSKPRPASRLDRARDPNLSKSPLASRRSTGHPTTVVIMRTVPVPGFGSRAVCSGLIHLRSCVESGAGARRGTSASRGKDARGGVSMAIAFRCPACNKTLRARSELAGRTMKCPNCTTPVTCPELVAVAEPIEEPWGHSSAYDDIDGGQSAPPMPRGGAAASTAEGRRPCPACGEMIVATAAKCRFCRTVFDQNRIKKAAGKKRKRESATSRPSPPPTGGS